MSYLTVWKRSFEVLEQNRDQIRGALAGSGGFNNVQNFPGFFEW